MRNSDEVKTIAEQMLALSAKLLQLVDMDETERRRFVEEVKKKCTWEDYTIPMCCEGGRPTKQ